MAEMTSHQTAEDDASRSGHKSADKNDSDQSENRFKCSICFEFPTDPVATLCGHMYCWVCLYTWLKRGNGQCPLCKSGVDMEKIIPIYGGKTSYTDKVHPASKEGQEAARKAEEEARSKESIPSRPRGQRTESSGFSRSGNAYVSFQARNYRHILSTADGRDYVTIWVLPIRVGTSYFYIWRKAAQTLNQFWCFSRHLNLDPLHVSSASMTRHKHCVVVAEEQRSQLISSLLVFTGIAIIAWAIFIEPLS